MKTIRAYALQSEADLARIALEGADIPAVVVGVGIGMKGGVLLVPEDRIEAALQVLEELESDGEHAGKVVTRMVMTADGTERKK